MNTTSLLQPLVTPAFLTASWAAGPVAAAILGSMTGYGIAARPTEARTSDQVAAIFRTERCSPLLPRIEPNAWKFQAFGPKSGPEKTGGGEGVAATDLPIPAAGVVGSSVMTDHAALVRAVCEHPDDDTPRLVFADLLEEEGDHARAHFVRTQVALARVPEWDPLWAKCRQFEPEVFRGWAMTRALPQPLPTGFDWRAHKFRRGFAWLARALSAEDVAARAGGLSTGPRSRP